MDKQGINANSKIDYVKPVLLDLGMVTEAYGLADCEPDGGTATITCWTGGTAGTDCSGNGGTAYACTGEGSTAVVT